MKSRAYALIALIAALPAAAQINGAVNRMARFTSTTSVGSSQWIFETNNGIGVGVPAPLARLHVAATGITGLTVDHHTTTDWNFGLMVNVDRDRTKAFTINSSVTNANLFTIWGNGMVNAMKIYAQEVDVTPGAIGIYWPDDVFDPQYRLRPLSDVAAFYTRHGHLPEVPSKAEVDANGISLGAMNAALLRKIEELTLYVVEQQKQLDALRAEVAQRGRS